MRVIWQLKQLDAASSHSVATIGNFDGMHQGHRALIALLRQRAAECGTISTVILFEPQPLQFFLKEKAPPRLMRLRDKLAVLRELGVEQVLCLRFNQTLANTSADDFVKNILVHALKIKSILIGDDFRFGKNRQGDMALLQQLSHQYFFNVEQYSSFYTETERTSSTKIRQLLQQGDCETATQFLGAPYRISAIVQHGLKLGRTLGFPTINIAIPPSLRILPYGIYVVHTKTVDTDLGFGAASWGVRPTVSQGLQPLFEVHLFDTPNEALYHQRVFVSVYHRLRDELTFESLDALKEKIAQDVLDARAFVEDKLHR